VGAAQERKANVAFHLQPVFGVKAEVAGICAAIVGVIDFAILPTLVAGIIAEPTQNTQVK
jgi:hypothetical protein